jgi:predicted deacylase
MIQIPESYLASREAFVVHANAVGAHVQSFAHGTDAETGITLTTEVALFGPKEAEVMIVIASGTHGVEGYAGAACQIHFMTRYLNTYAQYPIAFLLVHAVNPWGFMHDRRVTEENIDLNRNFAAFDHDVDVVSGYSAYHDLLVTNYRIFPYGLWNELKLLAGALTPRRWKSAQAAITTGQYTHPDGLFFGGAGKSQSRLIWEKILSVYLTKCKVQILLDIHTGLGKTGVGELISHLPASSKEFQFINNWFTQGLRSMVTGQSASSAVSGTMTAAFDRTSPDRSYAVGLEFGTRKPFSVLTALRADQWYWNNKPRVSEKLARRIRNNLKEAFVATDEVWCKKVTRQFDQVMDELVQATAQHL